MRSAKLGNHLNPLLSNFRAIPGNLPICYRRTLLKRLGICWSKNLVETYFVDNCQSVHGNFKTSVSFSYFPEGKGFSRNAQRFHEILLIGVTRSQTSLKKTGHRPQCARASQSASLRRNILRFTVRGRNFLVTMADEDWAAEVDKQERQISGKVSYCCCV